METLELIRDVKMVLDRSGFDISEIKGDGVPSFDLVSRRDNEILVIKILGTGSEMTRAWSNEIIALSRVLKASPFIITPSSRSSVFRDGVLYVKIRVPLMTFNTFFDHLIEEVPPMIYRGSNGFFVSIDGRAMNRRRSEMGISLGAMAEMLGVSRKAIQMYEVGMGADIEIALGIESILNISLIVPLDPFSYSDELQSIREGYDLLDGMKKQVFEHLDSLGMEVVPTQKCPFDALARVKVDLFLTSVNVKGSNIKKKAGELSSMSRVTGADPFLILPDDVKRKRVKGLPVLCLSELKSADHIEDLITMIRERL
ncbi:MAG: helix-turn-helix domain-containing protein [Candidatus Thermoplasmatota archaeon]|nr:helix-turn-helix domain-containing protein [Candidatus Thermoplasmatota archaeon]